MILTVAQYYTPMHRTIQVLHPMLAFELKAGSCVWAEPGGSDLRVITALLMFYLAVLSLDTAAPKFAHAGVEVGQVFWYLDSDCLQNMLQGKGIVPDFKLAVDGFFSSLHPCSPRASASRSTLVRNRLARLWIPDEILLDLLLPFLLLRFLPAIPPYFFPSRPNGARRLHLVMQVLQVCTELFGTAGVEFEQFCGHISADQLLGSAQARPWPREKAESMANP